VVDHLGLSRALSAALAEDTTDSALAVCRACVSWLPMTGASITVMDGAQGQEPVCATGPGAARIDELQFSLGEGPCVQAFATGRAVLVSDIAAPDEGRWPMFASAAAETGARGMYVFPLQAGTSRLGVLDCYRDSPGTLDDRERAGGLLAADAAMWALLDHLDGSADPDGRGWASGYDGWALGRAEVHQATGMLMAQAGTTAPMALAALRAAAFTDGRAIAEVAADVVTRRRRLEPDGSWRAVTDDSAGSGRPPPRPTEHGDDDEREGREDP
jgi:GAF domain-containing protein/ANTAR domain-containing protein